MTAARIAREPVTRVVSREELFTIPPDHVGLDSPLATNYDVAADGQRFLMARAVSDLDDVTPGLVVVLNWVEEMEGAVGNFVSLDRLRPNPSYVVADLPKASHMAA